MNTNSGNLESAAKLDAVWCKNQVELEKKLAEVQAREIEALTELRKRAEELESVQAQAAEMRQNVELHCAAISYKPFYLDKALSSDAGRALLDELEALRVGLKMLLDCPRRQHDGNECCPCGGNARKALARVEKVGRKA